MKKLALLLLVAFAIFSCDLLDGPETETVRGVDGGNNYVMTITNTGKTLRLVEINMTVNCVSSTLSFSEQIDGFAPGESQTFTYPLGANVFVSDRILLTAHVY